MQEISELNSHMKSLEKLEYDVLHKVFNMFVDIPENVAVNIPGFRDPSLLPQLKRVRLKIKNNIKIAKAQIKYYKKVPNQVSINNLNENFDVSVEEKKNVNKISVNSLNDNYIQLSDQKTEYNHNIDKYNENKLLNIGSVEEIQNENEIYKRSQIHKQSSSNNLISSKTQSKFQKPTCTITSSSVKLNENYDISCNEKCTVTPYICDQKSTYRSKSYYIVFKSRFMKIVLSSIIY